MCCLLAPPPPPPPFFFTSGTPTLWLGIQTSNILLLGTIFNSLWVIFVKFSYLAPLFVSFLWKSDTPVGVKIHPLDTPVGVKIHPPRWTVELTFVWGTALAQWCDILREGWLFGWSHTTLHSTFAPPFASVGPTSGWQSSPSSNQSCTSHRCSRGGLHPVWSRDCNPPWGSVRAGE